MTQKLWSHLKPGDLIDIIAPASRFPRERLEETIQLLKNWGLQVRTPEDLFGDDILCANSDEKRFQLLAEALSNTESKAILSPRGGYGSMRLIPQLLSLSPPAQTKLFIGMSDITALHIFLQQQWGWPTLHAAVAPARFSDESIEQVRKIAFGETQTCHFSPLIPLNDAAFKQKLIASSVVGGNLCLIQTSIGTPWQLDTEKKIILLEETNERGYRVDRILEHLTQARLFQNASAVLLGDFIRGEEADGTSLIEPVLRRFAASLPIPVLRYQGIGHDFINTPIPLGTSARLQLGTSANLQCTTGFQE